MGECRKVVLAVENDPKNDPPVENQSETFRPEEMGWVHKGGDTYEMPDGKLYIFPPRGQHILQKWVGKWPPWEVE